MQNAEANRDVSVFLGGSRKSMMRRSWITWALLGLGLLLWLALACNLPVWLPNEPGGGNSGGLADGASLTFTPFLPSQTPAPLIYCTPPPCGAGEEYYCPGNCPGGCGTICRSVLGSVSPVQPITPTASPMIMCTPPLCKTDEVFFCPEECPGGCGTGCATPTLPPATSTYLPGRQKPPHYPFPQHTRYVSGSILPNHRSQDELDRTVGEFYDQWKSIYLVQGCGEGRYFVNINAGSRASDQTTVSEAHGYGMMLSALMAGYDSQARKIFDGFFLYYKDHPSRFSPGLMAWKQVNCQNAGGDDSATDGDLDITFALLLADRQWGSAGTINYRQEAEQAFYMVKYHLVNRETYTLLLGDWVTPRDPKYYYTTRSSDFIMDHLRSFRSVTGDPFWRKVIDASYDLVGTLQSSYSPGAGLLPDFIQDISGDPRPAEANFLESTTDGQYGYNACRVPWRLGTDYLLSGDGRGLLALTRLNEWVRGAAKDDPANIVDGYDLQGNPLAGHQSNHLAFVAPFGVSAMAASNNQEWLNRLWDVVSSRPIKDEGYYGDTIKLLTMIVMSGNWWGP